MDKNLNLKRRVLGGFITVLALIVILPALLDSSRYNEPLFAETPTMPEVPDWAVVADEERVRAELEQLANDQAKEALTPLPIVVVEEDEKAVDPIEKAESSAPVPPNAWVLQLGAFSETKNAYLMRDNLRKKGYKAYTEEFPQDKLTRVYVGPEIHRQAIEALRDKLQKEIGAGDIHIKRWQPGR